MAYFYLQNKNVYEEFMICVRNFDCYLNLINYSQINFI